MGKNLLKESLVFVDFKENDFRFYEVEVMSIKFNELQIITKSGRLGTKGKESLIRTNDFKEAMKIANKKIYEKKFEGFLNTKKVEEAIEQIRKTKDNKYKNKKNENREQKKCDLCEKTMDVKMWEKINDWGRNEANWDHDENFIGYKKVICIDCQIDNDIHKKRYERKEE